MSRHLATLRAAWKAETARRRTERGARIDTEFLPAALEVVETPPSPLGRAVLWTILALVLVALVWSWVGRVDVVAVAEGRVVPRERLQAVEAAEPGIVRSILVREGERVEAGQPLLRLDPTMADADRGAARTELATAALQRARALAILAHLDGRPAAFAAPAGSDPAAALAEATLVAARIAEHEARLAGLAQRLEGARAALAVARAELTRADELLPLVAAQHGAQLELAAKGLTPQLRVLQLEERVVDLRRQREVERAQLGEVQAQIALLERERAQAAEEARARAAAELAEAEAIAATRAEALRKAERRAALQELRAPVAGTVHELKVTSLGEVVEAGAPLVTLVPAAGELIVEALVLNKDVGHVRPGRPVIVKVETWPFTRYGVLAGEVEQVSPDAVPDEARGLVFPVRVKLTRTTLSVTGEAARLSPGMSVTAEIVTGQRRVIDFVLSPMARAVQEAGRER